MKTILSILLVLGLCLSLLAGCKTEKTPETTAPPETSSTTEATTETPSQATEETTLSTEPVATESTVPPTEVEVPLTMDEIQKRLRQEQSLCAVAFLGAWEGNLVDILSYLADSGMVEALPVLDELTSDTFAEAEGSELYLVVPREDVGISVNEQSMDPESGESVMGPCLYVGFEPAPILLRGNISDIFPNLVLTLESREGEKVEYSPCLSLNDGSVCVTETILDLSSYELLNSPYDGPVMGEEDIRIGTWYTEIMTPEHTTVLLELVLAYDGTAAYGYGDYSQPFTEYFMGSWREENGLVILDLEGGPCDAEGMIDMSKEYKFQGEFEWDYQDRHLILTHVSGSSLMEGSEEQALDFVPCHFDAVTGLWSTSEYSSETDSYRYHDLELLANGDCNMITHNGESLTYAAYRGFWSLDQGTLSLWMEMFDGEEYREDDSQVLKGEYAASISDFGQLTLTLLDGSPLTGDMAILNREFFSPLFSLG